LNRCSWQSSRCLSRRWPTGKSYRSPPEGWRNFGVGEWFTE